MSATAAPLAGEAIRRAKRRTDRRREWRAFGLTLPLLGFLLVFFLLPIADMLRLAVANAELARAMPATAAALRDWDGEGLPGEDVARTLAGEMRAAYKARTLADVAKRLNNDNPGYRSMLMATGRKLPDAPPDDALGTLAAIDADWQDPALWRSFRRAAAPWTDLYVLQSLDLERGPGGAIQARPEGEAVYRIILWRTFEISLVVTLACLVLAYPLAYKLAHLREGTANLLMILVLLPFWTSLLVRSAAWIVLLQREGPINGLLLSLGLIQAPLALVFNRTGVLIAMTHVLLPFMVLPLYAVMRGIPKSHVRAALSLGAPPFTAFRRVFLPQTLPGIGAGALLVFILAIGYYITPALVGGADDQMLAYFVAFFTLQTVNWGMAAALASVLLVAVTALYLLYARVVGIDRIGIGG